MRLNTIQTATLACAIASALVSVVTGCANPRETQAEREIRRHLGDDARTVEVSIEADRAVLTGAVRNRSSRTLSEEIVLAQPGIAAVDNRVAVAERQAMERMYMDEFDKAMLMRVEFVLLRTVGPRSIKALQARATDGIVSFRGPVPSEEVRRTILDTTAKVEDVRAVIDLMTVAAPDATSTATSAPPETAAPSSK